MRLNERTEIIQEIVDECNLNEIRVSQILMRWRAKLEEEPTLLKPLEIDAIMRAVREKLET